VQPIREQIERCRTQDDLVSPGEKTKEKKLKEGNANDGRLKAEVSEQLEGVN